MKISDLIKSLEARLEEFGDLNCFTVTETDGFKPADKVGVYFVRDKNDQEVPNGLLID